MNTTALELDAQNTPVGIWIRVSTDQQAQGESPEHHLARAKYYAASRGWNVREVYDLAGVSGKSVLEHPEAKRMLRDIERGHIKSLIFSKLARLARNTRELLDVAEHFRKKGANLVSLQETLDTGTPAGMLFFTIISAMAEWERAEIGDRVKASISIRAKLGKQVSSKTPYGYFWKDQKVHQHPTEAPVRKLMYELFVKHRRLGAVARLLNQQGYRTRGNNRWSDMAIGRCIADWSAKGTYRTNVRRRVAPWKTEVKDESEWGLIPVEPLVSEQLWNEANQILEERKSDATKRPGPRAVHIFGGKVYCHCGNKMYMGSHTPKYLCLKCRNKILATDLEEIFIAELKDVFTNNSRLAVQISEGQKALQEKEQLLTAHKEEIERVRDQMTRTHQLYLDGQIIRSDFGKYHKPLSDRVEELQRQLPKLEAEMDYYKIHNLSADAVKSEANILYGNWPEIPRENRRRIIEGIVDKIVIHPSEIHITFSATGSSEEMTTNQQMLRKR